MPQPDRAPADGRRVADGVDQALDLVVARGGIEPPTRGFYFQSLAALAIPHSSHFLAQFGHTQSGFGTGVASDPGAESGHVLRTTTQVGNKLGSRDSRAFLSHVVLKG